MILRLVRDIGVRKGWAGPVAWLGLAAVALLAVACSAPAATPTPLPAATSTPPVAATDGADVGKLAYDFSVVGISNRQVVTRDSLRAQGKPYILYFFTSW